MSGTGKNEDAAEGNSALRRPTEAEFVEAERLANLGMYERRESEGAPNWALWQLHGRLVESAQLYESADLQDQRDAVAASLLAVHDYLTGRGFALAALAPIMRPVAALCERENKSLDLMFTERPGGGGRPKATMPDHERSGVLAALASHWLSMHASDNRKHSEKLKEAARKMKGPWFGTVTAANLKTARDLVMQESGDHPAVTEAARFGETIASVETKFGKADSFLILVRMLNAAEPMHSAATRIAKTPPVSSNGEE